MGGHGRSGEVGDPNCIANCIANCVANCVANCTANCITEHGAWRAVQKSMLKQPTKTRLYYAAPADADGVGFSCAATADDASVGLFTF